MLKRFLLALFLVVFGGTVPASAANRILVYSGMNPDVNLQNQNARFQRLQDGAVLRDLLGPLATSGAWSGLVINPASGLNVTIGNYPINQPGAIYQFGEDDANPLPNCCTTESLPADTTNIVIEALQPSSLGNAPTPINNSNPNPSSVLGPFTAPSGAGNYAIYRIEAQLASTIDTANNSYPFISQSGVVTSNSVPTQRTDVIAYQIATAGAGTVNTSCATAGVPAVDAGWISIGFVCIAHSQSSMSGATVCTDGWNNPGGCTILMDQSNEVVGGQFGKVSFGGLYAQNNNVDPSIMNTSQNADCDLSNVEGFVINNHSSANGGGHIVGADLSGNLAVCGSILYLFNQNSNSTVPEIVVNTPLDTGTATQETFFPATNTGTAHTSGSCANQTVCTLTASPLVICGDVTTANSAFITVRQVGGVSLSNDVMPLVQLISPGNVGLSLSFLNISGGSIGNNTAIGYTFVCL